MPKGVAAAILTVALVSLAAAGCGNSRTDGVVSSAQVASSYASGASPSNPVPGATTVNATTPDTSPTSTTSSTTTTTTVAPTTTVSGPLDDVTAAAALGALPEGTDLQQARARAVLYGNGCHLSWGSTTPLQTCMFGDLQSDIVIVITGDSHAAHWFGAFEAAALANHWKLVTVTKAGCPAADVTVFSAEETVAGQDVVYTACDQWRPRAQEYIRSLQPDLVVFPMLTRRGVVGAGGAAGLNAWENGLGRSIDAVAGDTTEILVLGDTPKTNGLDIPSCVESHRGDIHPCANPRSEAVLTERLAMLQRAAEAHDATFVDVSDWMCAADWCPAAIGGHVVYRDSHHLSDGFSRYRAPQVALLVRQLLGN